MTHQSERDNGAHNEVRDAEIHGDLTLINTLHMHRPRRLRLRHTALITAALAVMAATAALLPALRGGSNTHFIVTAQAEPDGANSWTLPRALDGPPGTTYRHGWRDASTWAPRLHGIATESLTIRVTLSASKPVLVEEVRPRIVQKQQPVHGTLLALYGLGGDTTQNIPLMHSDLDSSAGEVTNTDGAPFFKVNNISLSGDHTQAQFLLTASSAHALYRWEIVISYIIDGQVRHTVVRDPAGQPFAVQGMAEHYTTVLLNHEGDPKYRLYFTDSDDFCRTSGRCWKQTPERNR